jgi:predicted transposase YbfD/YdcC
LSKKNTNCGLNSSVIGLKSNCSALLASAKSIMMTEKPIDAITITDSRKITRTIEVFTVESAELPAAWLGVNAFFRVHRTGIRYSKKSLNRRRKPKSQAGAAIVNEPATAVSDIANNGCLPLQSVETQAVDLPIVATQTAIGNQIVPESKEDAPQKNKPSKGIPFEETAYYICTGKVPNAQVVAKAVQEHWGIENKIHRNKDVIFNEDKNKIKDKSIAANLSQIFNLSLNLFTCLGVKSLKKGIEKYAHHIKFFLSAINSINYI